MLGTLNLNKRFTSWIMYRVGTAMKRSHISILFWVYKAYLAEISWSNFIIQISEEVYHLASTYWWKYSSTREQARSVHTKHQYVIFGHVEKSVQYMLKRTKLLRVQVGTGCRKKLNIYLKDAYPLISCDELCPFIYFLLKRFE